jgi:hypothetical protein
MTMMLKMSENQSCQSQVHVLTFRCLRVKPKKADLNRLLKGHTAQWGLGSYPTPNHLIQKRTVNTTLVKVHHAELGYC